MKESGLDRSKYTDLYLSEAREHLSMIEEKLVRFPQEGDDLSLINDLFRHAHSLKGMSASMGFGAITEISHAMEEIFDLLKKRDAAMNSDLRSILMESIGKLNDMLDHIEKTGKEPEGARAHLIALEDAVHAKAIRAKQPHARSGGSERAHPGRIYDIEMEFLKDTPLPAARAVLVFKRLSEKGSIVRISPDLEKIRAGHFETKLSICLRTDLRWEDIETLMRSFAEIESFRIIPIAQEGEKGGEPGDSVLPSSIRIKTQCLDNFMDNLVELMIQHERISRMIEAAGLAGAGVEATKMDKTIRNLHDELVKIRMLPFSYISKQFERSVRSLAQSLGKRVTLRMTGETTEVDKSILEGISDPINHLIRNSIDHGIETPSARKKIGKNETGSIIISLVRKGGSVIVRVEDDGCGIDIEKMKRIALERNFITKEEYRSMSTDDAYMLLTIPGFSTVGKATSVSGRGIGLDAVRTKIENLGGKMKIGPRLGGGTSVEFTLPLTVAVISAFVVREGSSFFAVPASAIEKTASIAPADVVRREGRTFIERNGEASPLYELSSLIAGGHGRNAIEQPKHLLFFRNGERSAVLAVDEIVYRKDIVVKPLSHPLDQLRQYAGASFLEDGTIALILDIFNLTGT